MVTALSRSAAPRFHSCVRSAWACHSTAGQQQQSHQVQASHRRSQQTASVSTSARASASTSSRSARDDALAPGLMPDQVPNALPSRLKPASPSYYTTKPVFRDTLIKLEDLTRRTKRTLQQHSIPIDSPLLDKEITAARKPFVWPKVEEMSRLMAHPLSMSDYRVLHQRLNQLVRYRYFVKEHMTNGSLGEQARSLALEVEATLRKYNSVSAVEDAGGDAIHHRSFLSSTSGVDTLGRAYARGRRKESSARVWIIPSRSEELVSLTPSATTSTSSTTPPTSTISASVLINARSISEFFTRQSDREAALFPLRVVGMTGVFNVFALTRGGGTTGQTGAIAHGIARALVSFFDDKARKVEDAEGISSPTALPLRTQAINMRELLASSGILSRDRRMVERKKTNKAKARKSYTWVKR